MSELIDKNHQNEIDVEGFKIHISDLVNNKIIPESFNAPLITLWEITRKCNLNCIHCYNNSGKKLRSELSHEQKLNVAEQIAKSKIFRICLSGGEPILCESFWDVAEILNTGKVMVSTITNGWLVNDKNADLYSKYFKFVQVSIDGASPRVHDSIRGKKGSYERAVNACEYLVDNGVKLFISCVATSINAHETGELIDKSYDLGATSFRIDKVRFTGRAACNSKKFNLYPSKKQVSKIEKIIQKKKEEYGKEMNIDYFTDSVRAYNDYLLHVPNYLFYISPSGRCAPDSMIPFSGGSLKEKSLKEIWTDLRCCNKNTDYIKVISKIRSNEDYLKLPSIPYVGGELHDE